MVAGNILAAEDRLGTWPTLLTRSRPATALILGKLLVAVVCSAAAVALLALATTGAGLAIGGDSPLPGLSGQQLSHGHAYAIVLACWAATLPGALAWVTISLALSAFTRSALIGILLPALAGIVLQATLLVDGPPFVRLISPSAALDAWHPLLEIPASARTLGERDAGRRGLGGARRTRARGRPQPTTEPGGMMRRPILAAALAAACAVCAGCSGTAVTADRLEDSIAGSFTRMYGWQQQLLGKPAPARLDTHASCVHGAAGDYGAGQDWTCMIQYLESAASGADPVTFSYDVNVHPDLCWTAENPPRALGGATLLTATGRSVSDPLYVIDGCFQAG